MNSILNCSAAEIAALAMYETFPGIQLLGARRTSFGFSFDVRSSVALPFETEVLIEERMRQIVRENREMRVLEMVPLSARELLLKEGHLAQSAKIAGDALVQIVRIGNFHALSTGSHLSSTSQLAHFKLWPIREMSDGTLRLSGCAFSKKEELRNFLRRLRDYPDKSHERIGLKKSLWRLVNGKIIFLHGGLQRLGDVIQILRESLFEGALEIRGADRESQILLAKETGQERLVQIDFNPLPAWDPEVGLFSGINGTRICLYFSPLKGDWEKIAISSLQLLRRTLNILGFRYTLRFTGCRRAVKGVRILMQAFEGQGIKIDEESEKKDVARLDYLVEDELGRSWAVFSLELAPNGIFVLASIERLIALLMEMNGG